MANHISASELELLDKGNLYDLADGLLSCDVLAIEKCIQFILADTRGVWHGRARAMMCRRLKHCKVAPKLGQELVACITGRLAAGNFSQQFRDQLRLVMQLDTKRTFEAAEECLVSTSKDHIRKLANWVMDHKEGIRE